MNMKVWVVSEVYWQDRNILSVFSSLEKAQSFVNSFPTLENNYSYEIREYRVDEFEEDD